MLRFQPVTTEIEPLAPASEILAVANELALDIINQGGVQYLRYMASVDM